MDTGDSIPETNGKRTKGISEPEHEVARKDVDKTDITDDIDPANEIQGLKLVLTHFSICLCTFLIGLVSSPSQPVHNSNILIERGFTKH